MTCSLMCRPKSLQGSREGAFGVRRSAGAWWTPWPPCEKRRQGEIIAQRSQRRKLEWNTVALVRELQSLGNRRPDQKEKKTFNAKPQFPPL